MGRHGISGISPEGNLRAFACLTDIKGYKDKLTAFTPIKKSVMAGP